MFTAPCSFVEKIWQKTNDNFWKNEDIFLNFLIEPTRITGDKLRIVFSNETFSNFGREAVWLMLINDKSVSVGTEQVTSHFVFNKKTNQFTEVS